MEENDRKEILDTYKWIKVKSYKMNEQLSWEERYRELENHHIAETSFLIQKVREMVAQIPATPIN